MGLLEISTTKGVFDGERKSKQSAETDVDYRNDGEPRTSFERELEQLSVEEPRLPRRDKTDLHNSLLQTSSLTSGSSASANQMTTDSVVHSFLSGSEITDPSGLTNQTPGAGNPSIEQAVRQVSVQAAVRPVELGKDPVDSAVDDARVDRSILTDAQDEAVILADEGARGAWPIHDNISPDATLVQSVTTARMSAEAGAGLTEGSRKPPTPTHLLVATRVDAQSARLDATPRQNLAAVQSSPVSVPTGSGGQLASTQIAALDPNLAQTAQTETSGGKPVAIDATSNLRTAPVSPAPNTQLPEIQLSQARVDATPPLQPIFDLSSTIDMREPLAMSTISTLPSSGPAAPTALIAPTAPTQQILAQISLIENKASNGSLEVRLDPEELGKVRLNFVTRDTGLVVYVSAERPETLELLRRNSDELQLGLSDMNFEGANLEFSDGREGNTEAFDETADTDDVQNAVQVSLASSSIVTSADDRLDIRL